MEIVLGYDRKDDVLRLFQDYTASICDRDPFVRATLAGQHYEEEVAHLEEKYGLPKGRLYLAMMDEVAVGCGALTCNTEAYCELKRLYVVPGHRGLRIGEALLTQLIGDARAIGYQHMRLDTFPFMEAAIQLYEKHGFRRIERYNENPAPSAIFMALDL